MCNLLPNQKPKVKKWVMTGVELEDRLRAIGLTMPGRPWDKKYFFTNREGWGEILYHLTFSSLLYKPDIRDCDYYAGKAWVTCSEKYDLNALLICIGDIPKGRHAFNILFFGDPDAPGDEGFLLFEPNDGFPGSGAFEIGDDGYIPDQVFG